MVVDISKLINWVKDGRGRRSVDIKIGEPGNSQYLRIWAYDYDLRTGISLDSPDAEINLQAQKEASERLQYELLKAKYEGGKNI